MGADRRGQASSLSSRFPLQTSLEPGGQPLAFLGPQGGSVPLCCALPPLMRNCFSPTSPPHPASAYPVCRGELRGQLSSVIMAAGAWLLRAGEVMGLLNSRQPSHLAAPSPQLGGICSAFCTLITALPGLTPALLGTAP